MKDKTLVQKVYKGAYCSIFFMGDRFPDQKFIVRHRPNRWRAEPIGWGATEDEAWEYAANGIKVQMLAVLEQ